MSYKLFLDDIREPFWIYDDYSDWVIVRNMKEMFSLIKEKGVPSLISFDNDLGNVDGVVLPDGYECLNRLIDNDIYIKGIVVHSDNNVANEQIFGKANNWHKFLIGEGVFSKDDVYVIKRPAMFNLRKEYKNKSSD
jgi:hypothetical protein